MTQIYRATLFSPRNAGGFLHHPDGALCVDGAGRILAAGPFESVLREHPGASVTDLRPCWILPGLVDLHSHLPQYGAVAMDGLELLPWLRTHIFSREAAFADPELADKAARIYFRDQLSWGTTTAVVYVTVHAEATDRAFREAERCGIRAVLGKVMMDRNAPPELQEDTEASLAQSEDLCRTWQGRDGGRLAYAFTPRFAPTCSRELLAGAGRLAERHGAFIQTHISENLDEIRLVRELFPEATDYLDVYRRAGMVRPGALLGHGIHLAPGERAALKAGGAAIVHCPRSNAFLKSGIMPLRRWMEEGLDVGLGTDVGAGPSLDLWSEMAFACMASKLRWAALNAQEDSGAAAEAPVDPLQAFRLATLAGAVALGWQDRTGSLEPGKDADFIVVDPRVPTPGGELDPEEQPAQILSRLMYRPERAMLRGTWVRGRPCHLPAH